MARLGQARQGKARPGEARQGTNTQWKERLMKSVNITITGISPILMHRFPLEPIKAFEKLPPGEQAEHGAYRTPEGELYIPGTALQRALVDGAVFVKGKGRASLQKPVAACVFVDREYLEIGERDYIIDSRRVVMPSTKGSIIRHRPRIDEWCVSFTLSYDIELVSENQLREVVDNTGSRVGVLDFRPARKGPFGRFVVTKWENDKG